MFKNYREPTIKMFFKYKEIMFCFFAATVSLILLGFSEDILVTVLKNNTNSNTESLDNEAFEQYYNQHQSYIETYYLKNGISEMNSLASNSTSLFCGGK